MEEFLEMHGPGEAEKVGKLGKADKKTPVKKSQAPLSATSAKQ